MGAVSTRVKATALSSGAHQWPSKRCISSCAMKSAKPFETVPPPSRVSRVSTPLAMFRQ